MNKIFYLFLLFLSAAIWTGCFDSSNSRKYTVTTYFTSFDSASSKKERPFKYSYEIYNADSNMIYRELYVSPIDPDKNWGKLSERLTIVYHDRQIEKEIRVYGLSLSEKDWGTVVYRSGRESLVRIDQNGSDAKFYNTSKDFYDRLNRKKRTEFYDGRKRMLVFDYRYTQ